MIVMRTVVLLVMVTLTVVFALTMVVLVIWMVLVTVVVTVMVVFAGDNGAAIDFVAAVVYGCDSDSCSEVGDDGYSSGAPDSGAGGEAGGSCDNGGCDVVKVELVMLAEWWW